MNKENVRVRLKVNKTIREGQIIEVEIPDQLVGHRRLGYIKDEVLSAVLNENKFTYEVIE